jgi:hypothetical protein
VENVTVTENNQLVTVTWQPGTGSQQSSYRVRYRPLLRDPNAEGLEQSASGTSTQFSGTFPGEQYQISVYAVSGGVSSQATNAMLTIGELRLWSAPKKCIKIVENI